MRTFEMLASLEKDTLQYEKKYIRKDGRQIFAFINISTIHDADGKPAYVLAQIHDVTERKRLEDELRMHTEHLEELVEEKTRQLQDAQKLATIGETATMVGHDLRNPLQAIMNLIFIMDEMLDKAPPFTEKGYAGDPQEDRAERELHEQDRVRSDDSHDRSCQT
jgi:signal transduction histidine kinase